MSFEKQFDDDITFFTIGDSLIGGTDFIPSSASDVVQEWDKYAYTDYTSRILDISITRQVEPISSITMAMADVILDNHDDYFTKGKGSEIDDYILPYRPIRLYLGFGDEVIPMFIGITEKMPVIDEANKTATFHCIDYMSSIMNRPLNESVLFTNERTSEVMKDLFVLAGISTSQLDFEEGFNIIPYAYYEKGSKLGDGLEKLMEYEQGRLYMNEKGVIQFKNRQSYDTTNAYTFDAYHNINDFSTKTVDEIINVVEVKGKIRQLQAKQKYWELDNPIQIKAGESLEIWADFEDPVTSADDPEYITSASTSLFTVNTEEDGSGTNNSTDVTLTSSSLFAKSFKMVFANAAAVDLWITTLELFATPVKVVADLYIREEDSASILQYDERVYTIENDFFQSETDATSVALSILRDYATFGGFNQIDVKGIPALQLDDTVEVNVFDTIADYKITKVIDQISFPAKYTQIINLRNFTPTSYFTIQLSLIGGEDMIHP